MDLTAAHGNEVENLRKRLLPDRVYVKDRGYACFELFQSMVDIGSHFVCRVRDNSVYEVIEERELTPQAAEAKVVRDQVVGLGCASKRQELKQPLRWVRIACKPHPKRANKGPAQSESLLIATNLLDVPAEVVALIDEKRWTIELFFRFFKHVLGCRHLLSHAQNGIAIQVYMAILASMLIALWTGKKPTLRTVEMIQFYFTGWADAEEWEAHWAKLKSL